MRRTTQTRSKKADEDELAAEDYLHLRRSYISQLNPEIPACRKDYNPGGCSLNCVMINILQTIETLENCDYAQRNEAVGLLFVAVTGGHLMNGRTQVMEDRKYNLSEWKEDMKNLMKEFECFHFPLSKYNDIDRSYTSKPLDLELPENTAFICDASNSKELVQDLLKIYVEFRDLNMTREKREIVRNNLMRVLHASVTHASQFSILAYSLTLLFVQCPDLLEQPAALNCNDPELYPKTLKKGFFPAAKQEEREKLFYQINEQIKKHQWIRLQRTLPYEDFRRLSKEEQGRVMSPDPSVFEAAKITYIRPTDLAERLTRAYKLSNEDSDWVEERWNDLFFCNFANRETMNKRAAISRCKERPIGDILLALNTVLKPQNYIRILAQQEESIDNESASALTRLYNTPVIQSKEDKPTMHVMYDAISAGFHFRHEDITPLVFRLRSGYWYIAEEELDPFELTLRDSLYQVIDNAFSDYKRFSYLSEVSIDSVSSEVQEKVHRVQGEMTKINWCREAIIDFLQCVDIDEKTLPEDLFKFLRNHIQSKTERKWIDDIASDSQKHAFETKSLYESAMEQIKLGLFRDMLSTIWSILDKGGFPIRKSTNKNPHNEAEPPD